MLIRSGWEFMWYHSVMNRFVVFGELDLNDKESEKIVNYYIECITIKDRMEIMEEYLEINIVKIVDQYVGRNLE